MADRQCVVVLCGYGPAAREQLHSFLVHLAGLPDKSVNDALDALPVVLGNALDEGDANELRTALEQAGAQAEVVPAEDARDYPRLGGRAEPVAAQPTERPPAPPVPPPPMPAPTEAQPPSFVRPEMPSEAFRSIVRRQRTRVLKRLAVGILILAAIGWIVYVEYGGAGRKAGGPSSQTQGSGAKREAEPRGGILSAVKTAISAAIDSVGKRGGSAQTKAVREEAYKPATKEKTWYRCVSGADRPLVGRRGGSISRHDVTAQYGKAFEIRDGGVDVCSTAYAVSRGLPEAKEPYGADLSRWETAVVPPGRFAIDPKLGRFKFSQGKKADIARLGSVLIGWGEPNDVIVKGRYAYMAVAESSYNVVIYDVSSPSAPVKVGMVAIPESKLGEGVMEWPSRIGIDGKLLYIPGRGKTLGIVDVSNPESPKRLATVDVVGEADSAVRSVVGHGRYAYAYVYKIGLTVLDVSNPRKPQVVGSIKVKAPFGNLFPKPRIVRGHMLFPNNDSLIVFSLADPKRPREIMRVPTKCANLAVAGNYAYAAALGDGIVTLNVANASAPTVLGRADLGGRAAEIAVSDGRAFVLVRPQGHEQDQMVEVDISNPARPRRLDSVTADASSPGCRAFDDPRKPGERGRVIPVINADEIACHFMGIAAQGGHVFVADQRFGLRVFDASGGTPQHVAGVKASGEVSAICAHGDTLYIGQNMKSGLSIIDVSNHAAPRWVSYFHTSTDIWSVATYRGQYVYFSGYSGHGNRLYALDVRDPAKPKPTWTAKDKYAMAAAVQDDLLFHGGEIYSLADPAKPKFLAHAVKTGVASMGLGGRHAYFLSGREFIAVDVSDPTKPVTVGKLTLDDPQGWFIHAMQAAGNLVYVPLGPAGIAVVDVSQPSAPRLAQRYPVTSKKVTIPLLGRETTARNFLGSQIGISEERGTIIALNVVGPTLYAADYWDKIMAIDVANPQKPSISSKTRTYYAWKMLVHGGYLYWARLDGVSIFSIPRPPETPSGTPRYRGLP